MGRNNYFQFKEFRVEQQLAAMKVGIDGVLLGAWADLSGAGRVLDVGTGTGLLALMVAQRSDALVDAVELDTEAAQEACGNFKNSRWPSRLQLTVGAFQDFQSDKTYDHIISNPPFFVNGVQSPNQKRSQARHSARLSLKELLKKASGLLTDSGKISLIVPAEQETRILELANRLNLYVNRLVRVAPDESKKAHRLLLELSTKPKSLNESCLFIRDKEMGDYSTAYRELTRDFYLAL
ncbi:tRNA1(Val) (adenine(37)-N6)-methyltransferase [Sunxiuqinia sp. sy24]|uniref:tRNA1(Val) (adenine(37)-N6)-methyltransferase n=1 Tax=Sunxiuqinia sp. sy24 TaxID=3461495 RepID=UPI004045E057